MVPRSTSVFQYNHGMTNEYLPGWVLRKKERIPTPCYVYDELELAESARQLATVLPPDARLFYSLKANPQPQIARFFHGLGIKPEIASEGELEMCLAGGVPSSDVLVGGVAKSQRFLERMCREGCFAITIDSAGELERLMSVPEHAGTARFLLRVNPGIAIGGLDMGGDSQFGISVADAIDTLRRGNFHAHKFLGLHFYFGSQRLKPEPIVKTVTIVTDVLRQFAAAGVPIKLVDVGLGCGVPYLEKDPALDLEVVRRELTPLWSDPVWSGVELWSEAGRSLVAHAGSFISTVIERKQLNGRTYVLLDGGLNVHNPGVGLGRFFKSNPRFQFVAQSSAATRERIEICGSLCTSADRLGGAVDAPYLTPGDLVVIPNSGAYCQTTAMWGFNSQTPFHEAMLGADGELRHIEPQYRTFMARRSQ